MFKMSTPLGSPSHPKSPSTSSQSRHSRKRTLDEIETPATSRAQRKMEAGLIRTPPRSHQASESNPEAPRTVRRETPNGAATHDLHNGTDHDPNPAPTNNLQKEEGMIDDAIPEGPEPGTPLEPYDWSDLERRFDAAMEERLQVEQGIQQDFQKLTEVSIQLHSSISRDLS